MATILLLHGPNLNLLGQREPEIYGTASLDDYVAATARAVAEHGHLLEDRQSNHEGDLVDAIHAARGQCAAIIINPGAFTHYSWAIHDALAAFDGVVVEVHISNPHAREPWRHTSVVAPVADGSIVGFGMLGYQLAVAAVSIKLELAEPDDAPGATDAPDATGATGATEAPGATDTTDTSEPVTS